MIETHQKTTTALPKSGVNRLRLTERRLATRTNVPVEDEPETEAVADLAADTFWTIFKREPEFADDVAPARVVNRALLRWAMESPGFENARQKTIGHLPAALASTRLLHSHLLTDDAYAGALALQEEIEENERERAKSEANADALDSAAAAAAANGDAETAAGLSAAAAEARAEANERAAAIMAAIDQIEREVEKIENDPIARASMNAAAREAEAEADEVSAALASWGVEAGSPAYRDPATALRMMELMTGKTARIAKLVGRFRGIATDERSTVDAEGYTPTDAEYSQDFRRIFPENLARLSAHNHPALRAMALAEFVRNGMLSWRYEGEAEEAGNFYALVDESGSMRGAEEEIAKAVLLGTAQSVIESGQNRRFEVGAFAGRYNEIRAVSSDEGPTALLEWAGQFIGGGTDFDHALNWALDKIEADHAGGEMRGADVVIITDGIAPLREETRNRFRAVRDDAGIRLFYVPIGVAPGSSVLDDFADVVLSLSSLEDGGEEFARSLAQWAR